MKIRFLGPVTTGAFGERAQGVTLFGFLNFFPHFFYNGVTLDFFTSK